MFIINISGAVAMKTVSILEYMCAKTHTYYFKACFSLIRCLHSLSALPVFQELDPLRPIFVMPVPMRLLFESSQIRNYRSFLSDE